MDKITADKIFKEISDHVNEEVSYLDALVHYAETHDIEIEVIGDIVRRSSILKSKCREDAEKLKLVERESQLPFK